MRANITGHEPFIEIMLQMALITFKNIFYHYTIAYCAEVHLFSCCNVHIRDFLSANEIHCNLHSETRSVAGRAKLEYQDLKLWTV